MLDEKCIEAENQFKVNEIRQLNDVLPTFFSRIFDLQLINTNNDKEIINN